MSSESSFLVGIDGVLTMRVVAKGFYSIKVVEESVFGIWGNIKLFHL